MLGEEEKKYMINTYGRQAGITPVFVRGSGTRVFDSAGKEYLDFVGGLAVNALGHCHPAVVKAACGQLEKLIHTSNLYYTEPQVDLARCLVEHTPADRVFFCNSGAEANEAAIKIARKYAKQHEGSQGYEIITAYHSFHGRTMATLTATGQEKFHKGYEPLVPGFRYAVFNDLDSFRSMLSKNTCAVMLEPVQGEGGVHVAGAEFVRGLRQLCDDNGLLLIFDEVQCGLGRTGKLLAADHYGIAADIFTLAKALGGGLPIGAMLCTEKVAEAFSPGDHASTFGGNPVACAAAVAVLREVLQKGFLAETEEKGRYFKEGLLALQVSFPGLVKDVRGLGLILGMELAGDGQLVQRHCTERGLLINCIAGRIIRFLPPLNVKREEIDSALAILEESLEQLCRGGS
ncbi:MAG: aspartate aminotransferase family protein [Bacillota bacterium]